MQPEARSVVEYSLDCLWATGSIVNQRLMAKHYQRALLLHPPAQPIRTSMRRGQTACRSWSVGRSGSSAAAGASKLMSAAVSQPLSSSVRPGGLADGRVASDDMASLRCGALVS
eukprot:5959576-Prymnesium_polylepis.1